MFWCRLLEHCGKWCRKQRTHRRHCRFEFLRREFIRASEASIFNYCLFPYISFTLLKKFFSFSLRRKEGHSNRRSRVQRIIIGSATICASCEIEAAQGFTWNHHHYRCQCEPSRKCWYGAGRVDTSIRFIMLFSLYIFRTIAILSLSTTTVTLFLMN